MDIFTRLFSLYREWQLYFRTREDFIWRAIWKYLTILTGFYSAISIIISPFILSNWLPAEEWFRMSLLFWSIMLASSVLLFSTLCLCLFFRRGKAKFDRVIKYQESDIERRLDNLEAAVRDVKGSLDRHIQEGHHD